MCMYKYVYIYMPAITLSEKKEAKESLDVWKGKGEM